MAPFGPGEVFLSYWEQGVSSLAERRTSLLAVVSTSIVTGREVSSFASGITTWRITGTSVEAFQEGGAESTHSFAGPAKALVYASQ